MKKICIITSILLTMIQAEAQAAYAYSCTSDNYSMLIKSHPKYLESAFVKLVNSNDGTYSTYDGKIEWVLGRMLSEATIQLANGEKVIITFLPAQCGRGDCPNNQKHITATFAGNSINEDFYCKEN